jgi:hypothetical protein
MPPKAKVKAKSSVAASGQGGRLTDGAGIGSDRTKNSDSLETAGLIHYF